MAQSIHLLARTHRAGAKIRAFRTENGLSAEELGKRIDPPRVVPAATVYNWESQGKIARPKLQRRLAELKICDAADWLEPARPQGGG